MANIEISTFTRNNDGNTYIIKDANAIPKTGSNQISGSLIPATDNTVSLGSINNHINNIYCTEVRGSDSNCCTVCGGSAWLKGAGISLRGKDYSGESGEFVLVAVNDTNMSDLRGKPNGILMWNGKNIDCVEEQGDGYIRYSNGLQICWVQSAQSNSVYTWNFPKTFLISPVVTATIYYPADDYNKFQRSVELNNLTSTGVLLRAATHMFGNNAYAVGMDKVNAIAIGRWK